MVLVSHLTKGGSRQAIYRAAGSIAVVGLSRSVLVAGPEPATGDQFRRVLALAKSNQTTADSIADQTIQSDGGAITNKWPGLSK